MPEFLDESRIAALRGIIERSRRVTGSARLSESELESTIEAWADVVSNIRTERLDDCYLEAIQAHEGRGPLQPRALVDAWFAIRNSSRLRLVDPINDSDKACGLCDSEGWQRFEIACPTVGRSRIVVRGCACSYATPAERKPDPLRPPDWARNPDSGVWLPQTLQAIRSKPCNCSLCKAEAAVTPAEQTDSKWTKFDPEFFQGLVDELQARRERPLTEKL
jgi:hypothetical protein